MLLLWSYRAERSNGRTAAVRPGVTVGEEVLEPRRLQQLEPTRWLHHSRDPAALSDSPTPRQRILDFACFSRRRAGRAASRTPFVRGCLRCTTRPSFTLRREPAAGCGRFGHGPQRLHRPLPPGAGAERPALPHFQPLASPVHTDPAASQIPESSAPHGRVKVPLFAILLAPG